MGWPQWALIVLLVLADLTSMVKHGKEREGKYDFPTSVLGTVLTVWLLWMGGFFEAAK